MEEILTPIMLIILIYIVYNYKIYLETKKVKSCTVVYKPE